MFLCVRICEMFIYYSNATRFQDRVKKRATMTLIVCVEGKAPAMMTNDRLVLQNVWNEVDFPLDMCPVNHGALTEHL
ncbi:hypothetical protein J437_LFUL011116 [Ladona fulva]|uniref:Uncharacterized protein n=1 Tax=Ladona fulva TaxID=123851 RepID=A0A8K0P326_LADFU|nr:hypothetical protein J437_LFUL011116 [Ladona fulva]